MKKLLIAAACVLCFSSPALAGQNNYGCGLGSMIWEDADGLLYELFAVGTNAFFGNQTLGISSGTSNCQKPEGLFSSRKVQRFVADNMDSLAGDIAKGNGEYVETLAILLEIPGDDRPGFYARLQDNFTSIYPSDTVTHQDVITNIAAVM